MAGQFPQFPYMPIQPGMERQLLDEEMPVPQFAVPDFPPLGGYPIPNAPIDPRLIPPPGTMANPLAPLGPSQVQMMGTRTSDQG